MHVQLFVSTDVRSTVLQQEHQCVRYIVGGIPAQNLVL